MSSNRGLAAAILSAVGLVIAVPAANSQISIVKCSTSGLRFTRAHGGVTDSEKVKDLYAHDLAKCSDARTIAKAVARDLLNHRKVPGTIDHYSIKLTKPCAACRPIAGVVARNGSSRRITFKVAGGA